LDLWVNDDLEFKFNAGESYLSNSILIGCTVCRVTIGLQVERILFIDVLSLLILVISVPYVASRCITRELGDDYRGQFIENTIVIVLVLGHSMPNHLKSWTFYTNPPQILLKTLLTILYGIWSRNPEFYDFSLNGFWNIAI